MTWACFLPCYRGTGPPYKLVAGSQKGNRDLPEKLWANCPSELDSRRVLKGQFLGN
jgi:hypothetical protein